MVLWSKPLGMSPAFYLVVVLEVLVADGAAVVLSLDTNKHVKILGNRFIE